MWHNAQMSITIPPIQDVREQLSALGVPALRELAGKTQVPFDTLTKIRSGYTPNRGIETVRKFYPELKPLPRKRKREA